VGLPLQRATHPDRSLADEKKSIICLIPAPVVPTVATVADV